MIRTRIVHITGKTYEKKSVNSPNTAVVNGSVRLKARMNVIDLAIERM